MKNVDDRPTSWFGSGRFLSLCRLWVWMSNRLRFRTQPLLPMESVQRDRTRDLVLAGDICLLLALALAAVMTCMHGSILHWAQSGNDAPPLDSFAQPSLALAVLNREVQRLMMDYGQADRRQASIQPAAGGSAARLWQTHAPS